MAIGGPSNGVDPEDQEAVRRRSSDLLYFLYDAREPDVLSDESRVELVRYLGHEADCTKVLYACGGMIVARAGNVESKDYVRSPVPVTVNGRVMEGKGEVLFAWGLPVSGRPLQESLMDGAGK